MFVLTFEVFGTVVGRNVLSRENVSSDAVWLEVLFLYIVFREEYLVVLSWTQDERVAVYYVSRAKWKYWKQ